MIFQEGRYPKDQRNEDTRDTQIMFNPIKRSPNNEGESRQIESVCFSVVTKSHG
eukprot:CAMPEP_0185761792 /NCGR_PEP_ID=MMETSP1174-20130828/20732_1 /TAXON_ID=35687 /ORGANISM="Dictyocha speculum, Strain CCMP1381" /LENGTH=53 /DNA_ID=CAMNT_0028443171 /DNA_START=31 /DNA_END=188 /DNA_ORIENTATION=+